MSHVRFKNMVSDSSETQEESDPQLEIGPREQPGVVNYSDSGLGDFYFEAQSKCSGSSY